MLGIDIYRYQTVTDPAAVARAGVKYAWVKGTDGFGKAQAPADNQVRQMKAAGIPVGLYHYAQLGDPRRQAEIFINEVNRLGAWGVMPALDLEDPHVPGAAARSFAIAFLQRMVELGVKRPVLYANTSMLNSIKPYQWNIPGLVIWAADYGSNNGVRNPDLRPYTGPVDVHQYTSNGIVGGIAGRTDLNFALTTRHLNTVLEDDMPLNGADVNLIPTGSYYHNGRYRTIGESIGSAQDDAAETKAIARATLEAVTNDGELDEARIRQLFVEELDKKRAADAEAIRAAVRETLTDAVTDEAVEEIVDRLTNKG